MKQPEYRDFIPRYSGCFPGSSFTPRRTSARLSFASAILYSLSVSPPLASISSACFFAFSARGWSMSSFHSQVVARRRQVPFMTESMPPMQAAALRVPSSITTVDSPIPRAVQKLQWSARMARSPVMVRQMTFSTFPSKRRPSGVPICNGNVFMSDASFTDSWLFRRHHQWCLRRGSSSREARHIRRLRSSGSRGAFPLRERTDRPYR